MFVSSHTARAIFVHSIFAITIMLVGFVGYTVTAQRVVYENETYAEQERLEASRFASQLRARIEQALNQRLFTVTGLKSFVVENNYVVEESKFQQFASALAEDTGSIRSLQLAPDAVVEHIFPLVGNEEALGHNLLEDDVRRAAVLEAVVNEQYTITGPIELLQGGNALIARLPIYTPETASTTVNADGISSSFWGFATVLVDVDTLYQVIDSETFGSEYAIALRGRNGTGAQGDTFYGEETLFRNDPVTADIILPVGSWQLAAVPNVGWATESPLTFYIWVIGLIATGFVIVLLGALYVFVRKQVLFTHIDHRLFAKTSSVKNYLYGALLFIICSSLTAASYWVAADIFEEQAEQQFYAETENIREEINDRVEVYINALEGGVGLLAASDNVDRDEWRKYVASLTIDENYPGIQGIGYSIFVPAAERAAHIEAVRSEGFPAYTIKPEGERDPYTAIIYLEPFDIRNQQAFGFDMYQEANRNEAMQTARDTGEASISRKITLVQEIDDDVQPGFLIYLPFYEGGIDPEVLSLRRDQIVGYVYSPFRSRDFIQGIIGVGGEEAVGLAVYDGPVSDDTLLYSDLGKIEDIQQSRFSQTLPIMIADKEWTLVFASSPNYGQVAVSKLAPVVVVGLGLLITLLIYVMFYSISSSRRQAEVIATEMTSNYRAQRKRLESFNAIVTMPEVSTEQRIKNTLKIVVEELGLETGMVSQVEGDVYTVRYITTKNQNLRVKAGHTLPLASTCCAVLKSVKKMVAINDLAQSKYANSECYKKYRVRAYIGTKLVINGRDYGTVTFRSRSPRAAFTDDDTTFVSLATRWIARMIENQEIDRSKNEFVSLASHQLRTPLSIINWYSEALLDEKNSKLSKSQKEYLQEIKTGNSRMTELVNALLNTSRLDLGTFKIEPKTVKLRAILSDLKKRYAPLCKEKNVKWSQSVDSALTTIEADETILDLIFDNIISNAIKYSKENGKVRMVVNTLPQEKFSLTVVDDGLGIPEDQKELIFTKMFRADNVTSEDTTGTGLGLYMVKSIIEKVGGSIEFISEKGKGTTFTVTLPQKMSAKQGTSRLS